MLHPDPGRRGLSPAERGGKARGRSCPSSTGPRRAPRSSLWFWVSCLSGLAGEAILAALAGRERLAATLTAAQATRREEVAMAAVVVAAEPAVAEPL